MSNSQAPAFTQNQISLAGRRILFGAEALMQSTPTGSYLIQFDSPFNSNDIIVQAGIQDPDPTDLTTRVVAHDVTSLGFCAHVETTSLPMNKTLGWVAMGPTGGSLPSTTITVDWANGVENGNTTVTEPTTINFTTTDSNVNIVGIFGLKPPVFGLLAADKPTQSSALRWSVVDHCPDGEIIFYSVLLENNNQFTFHDPKITNMPTPPGP